MMQAVSQHLGPQRAVVEGKQYTSRMEPHGPSKRVPDLVLLRYAASLATAGLSDPDILSKAEPDSVALLHMASAAAEAADTDALESDPVVQKQTVQIATDVYAAIDSIRSSAGGGGGSELEGKTGESFDLLKQASEAAEAVVQSAAAAAALVEHSPRTELQSATAPPIAARLAAYVQASGTADAVKAAGAEAAARAAQVAAGMRATARAAAIDAAKVAAAAASTNRYGSSSYAAASSTSIADLKVAAAAARLASRAAAAASLKERKSQREFGDVAAAAAAAASSPLQLSPGSLSNSRRSCRNSAVEAKTEYCKNNVATHAALQQPGRAFSFGAGYIAAAAAAAADSSESQTSDNSDLEAMDSYASLKQAAKIAIAGAAAAAAECVAAFTTEETPAARSKSDLVEPETLDSPLSPAADEQAETTIVALLPTPAAAARSGTLDISRIELCNPFSRDLEPDNPAAALLQEPHARSPLATDSDGVTLDGFFRDDSLGGSSSLCSSAGGQSTYSECWLPPQQLLQQQRYTHVQQQQRPEVNRVQLEHPQPAAAAAGAAVIVPKQLQQQQHRQQLQKELVVKLTLQKAAATDVPASNQQHHHHQHQQKERSVLAPGPAAAAPAGLQRTSQSGPDNHSNSSSCISHKNPTVDGRSTLKPAGQPPSVSQQHLQQQHSGSSCSSSSSGSMREQSPQQQQQQQGTTRPENLNRNVSWVQALVAQENRNQNTVTAPEAAAVHGSTVNGMQQQNKQVPRQQLQQLRLQRLAAVAAHMRDLHQHQGQAELQGQTSHQSQDSELTLSSELQSEVEPVSPDGWRIPSNMQHRSCANSPEHRNELCVKVPSVNSPTAGNKSSVKTGTGGVKLSVRVMGQQALAGAAAAAAAPLVAAAAMLGINSNASPPKLGQKELLLKPHTVSSSNRSSYSSGRSSASDNDRNAHGSSSSQPSVFKQETGRFWQRNSKQKYALCVLLPLLLVGVLIGGGFGAWAWVRKQHGPPVAQVADVVAQPLAFQVAIEAPARFYPHSCDIWFGDPEDLESYKVTLADAYASALNTPLSDFRVGSVTCNGTVMTGTSSGSSMAPRSRLLLAAAAAAAASTSEGSAIWGDERAATAGMPTPAGTAAAASSSSSSSNADAATTDIRAAPSQPTVIITTRFTISATSSIATQSAQTSRAVDIVKRNSYDILAEPIGDFLGVGIRAVVEARSVEGYLADSPMAKAAAAAAVPASSSSNDTAALKDMPPATAPPLAAPAVTDALDAAPAAAVHQQQQQDEARLAAATAAADEVETSASEPAAAAVIQSDWIDDAWPAVWPSTEPAEHSSSSEPASQHTPANLQGGPAPSSSSSSSKTGQGAKTEYQTGPTPAAPQPGPPTHVPTRPPLPDAQPIEVHSVVSTGANNRPQTNIWLSWQKQNDPAKLAALQAHGLGQRPEDQGLVASNGVGPDGSTSTPPGGLVGSATSSAAAQAAKATQPQQSVAAPAPELPTGALDVSSDPVEYQEHPGTLDKSGSSSSSVQGLVPDQSLEEPLPEVFPADLLDPKRHTVAPTCLFAPTSSNSLSDGQGRLWGWMKGTSCLFRKPADTGLLKPSGVTYDSAPICKGTPDGETSLMDEQGKLWGWQNRQSCAYRGVKSNVAVARGQLPIEKMPMLWEDAPKCSTDPTIENTMPDAFGRFWGEDNGQTCAFKL